MKYLRKFENHAAYEAAQSGLILPNVSLCVQENEVHYNPYIQHDYSQYYLTFTALESGTFKFSGNSINYSLDNGTTWTSLASNTKSPTVSAGSKILWKASGLTPSSRSGIGTFSSTANFTVEGNVMSLLYGDDFADQTNLSGKDYAFMYLFKDCIRLTSAENLSLPATTLASHCYRYMFRGCTSLTTAPQLPATILADDCYSNMFQYCTSLTTAPELPATTLVERCYEYMLSSCTSLTTAPELPATTLTNYCYNSMFQGCTSLNYIKAMFTTTPSISYMNNWVNGVASSGTFVKNSAAQWTSSCGVSTYPCNWTVETASS